MRMAVVPKRVQDAEQIRLTLRVLHGDVDLLRRKSVQSSPVLAIAKVTAVKGSPVRGR